MMNPGFFAERARNLRYAATTARMNGATQSALVYDARAHLAEAYAVRAATPPTLRSGINNGDVWCPIK